MKLPSKYCSLFIVNINDRMKNKSRGAGLSYYVFIASASVKNSIEPFHMGKMVERRGE